jgi:hypothetical protein
MSGIVIERQPLAYFTRDLHAGTGWVLDGRHHTDAEAAVVVAGFGFAGFVREGGFAASDSRERLTRYCLSVQAGKDLAARLSAPGDCPDYVTAAAEAHLNDGWDPEAVRCNPGAVGPFLDAGEVADRMNELAGGSGS